MGTPDSTDRRGHLGSGAENGVAVGAALLLSVDIRDLLPGIRRGGEAVPHTLLPAEVWAPKQA